MPDAGCAVRVGEVLAKLADVARVAARRDEVLEVLEALGVRGACFFLCSLVPSGCIAKGEGIPRSKPEVNGFWKRKLTHTF